MPLDTQAVIRGWWIVCSPVLVILIVLMITNVNDSSFTAFQVFVVLSLLSLVFTITLHQGWRQGRLGYQELPPNAGEGAGWCEGPANVSARLLDSGVPRGVEVVPPSYKPTRSSLSASDTSLDLLNPTLSI